MGRKHQILTGLKFGRLTVVSEAGQNKWGDFLWNCQCECGGSAVSAGALLRKGHTQSCGCLQRERTSQAKRIHGRSHTKECDAWCDAKGRCFRKTHKHYHLYGGRGITMCARWKGSFVAFFEDIGLCPTGKNSIDRVDNNGNYSCGKCLDCVKNGWSMNVRWATQKEQTSNTRRSRKYKNRLTAS